MAEKAGRKPRSAKSSPALPPEPRPLRGTKRAFGVKTATTGDLTATATINQCTDNTCYPRGCAHCVDLTIYLPLGAQVVQIRYYTTAGYPNDVQIRQIGPGDIAWSYMEPATQGSTP